MSLAIVAAIKAHLEAAGEDLSGPCGAFAITQRVAWALRADGAGLLDKPGGNNCLGFATDYVVFRNGPAFDILGDGGGANVPQWNQDDDRALLPRWRAPIAPDDVVTPPVGPPDPPADDRVEVLLEAIHAQLDTIDLTLHALALQSDINTEKIQRQIHEVVKNGEKSLAALLPLLKGGGGFGGLFKR
jgi:hypothetical protein